MCTQIARCNNLDASFCGNKSFLSFLFAVFLYRIDKNTDLNIIIYLSVG